jgi:hypothetical protein
VSGNIVIFWFLNDIQASVIRCADAASMSIIASAIGSPIKLYQMSTGNCDVIIVEPFP